MMTAERPYTFICSDIPKRIFRFFQDLRNRHQLCDVTFHVGDQYISAHRIIIAAVIPYFRDALEGRNVQREEEGIKMPDIEPAAFKCMIEFAYSHEAKIDAKNVKNLLAAACYLEVDEVKEACCDYLSDMLDNENVVNILELAQNLNCLELLKVIDRYFTEHFVEISQTKSFLDCPLTYVKDLIRKDDLYVESEKEVLEAVLKWVKYSPTCRQLELPDLLSTIRMPLIEPIYLAEIVDSEELLRLSVLCRDLLDEARNYNLFPKLRKIPCSFSTEPRQFTKITCMARNDDKAQIYKFHYKMLFTVQQFDLSAQKWLTRGSANYYENFGSAVEFKNKMYYFIWGYVKRYDPVKNVYDELNEMPTPRCDAGTSAMKNKIYVCGGRLGSMATNVVECFDPENNTWDSVRGMRTSRWGPSVVTLGERTIFVLGGQDSLSVHNTVEVYDPETDKWTFMSPMLTKRCVAGAATLNRKLYVCGGRTVPNGTNCVASAEVYDSSKNQWTFITPMSTPRQRFVLLPCRGKFYALGGKTNNWEFVHYFDIYDPDEDEWTIGPSADISAHPTSAAVVLSQPAS